MKLITILSLVATLLQISLQAKEINLNKLINTANKQNKHLFVWLHKHGCSFCDNMEHLTLDDKIIKSRIKNNFIYTKINSSSDEIIVFDDFVGSAKEFAIYVGHNFYPTSLFFDKDEEIVYESVGYKNKKDFKIVLDYVSSKSYDN